MIATGDLNLTVDCRRMYAAVLEGRLGLRPNEALVGAFVTLSLFRS